MRFTKDEIRKAMLLYAVTDSSWLKEGQTLVQVVEDVLANGATFLQIREKEMEHGAFLAEARQLQAAAVARRVPFVVNDAIDMGKDVRAMIGPDKILGISANTVETAVAAQAAGADYIGVGAVFPTSTKKDAKSLSREEMRAICEAVDIPVVAIGGINAGNLPQLAGSGVDGVAVVSAIFAQPDPGAATRHLLELARTMVASHG